MLTCPFCYKEFKSWKEIKIHCLEDCEKCNNGELNDYIKNIIELNLSLNQIDEKFKIK